MRLFYKGEVISYIKMWKVRANKKRIFNMIYDIAIVKMKWKRIHIAQIRY